ncbi:MAG: DUF11 domain-containing protein [Gaiellaceae bacterium]
MPLSCRPYRRFAYLFVLALALTLLAGPALAQQIPGRDINIPPGSSEGGVGGFWAHWLSVDNSGIANGSEFYAFFSIKFDAGTSWPVNNFEPTFNLHVTSSNPAYNGLAVSPVQVDFNGGTVQLYTHGGGTYNSGCNCYDNVQIHDAGPTLTIHPGVLYDFSLHAVISTSNTTGYAELWAYAHDGSMAAPVLVDSVHSATMYNGDPGPLSLYYGFYTRGAPGASPQPNNDQATFNENVWLPRIGPTIASALAHTPTVNAEWGSLDRDTTITVNGVAPPASPPTLDTANFVCPIPWNCTTGSTSGQTNSSTPPASSPPATSQSTSQAAPAGPDMPLVGNFSSVTDAGCGPCVVSTSGGPGHVNATIGGGLDTLDTAYGLADFGGSSGWSGRVWTRDVIALAPSTPLGGNLSILQQRDASGNLVWEIYVDGSNRQISLWSPAGGLGSSAINQSTGVAMDGQSHNVEVSALPNDSVVVRVDGQDRITDTGLSGSTSGKLRFLRVGIDHYDTGTTNEPISISHSDVGVSTLGWLGSRVSALAATSAASSGAAGATSNSSGGGGGGGAGADLSLALSATPAVPTDTVTYTAVVSDANGGPGSNLVLKLNLPSSANVVSMSADRGSGCTGTTKVTCNLDWISGSLAAHVTITARVPTGTQLTATGSVSETESDPNLTNNSASVTVGPKVAFGVPASKPSGGKSAPNSVTNGKKSPSARRPVVFVERPSVAGRRTVLVRLATHLPRMWLQIIIRDARGRNLGSTYAVSTRHGRSLQLVTLRRWRGQSKVNVIVKSHMGGHLHRTNMRIRLSNRELATCRGAH